MHGLTPQPRIAFNETAGRADKDRVSLSASDGLAVVLALTLTVPGMVPRVRAQDSIPAVAPSQLADLEREARAGQAKAQVKLGDMLYQSGDFTNAARFYYRAARQGLPEAQLALANCYVTGQGVPQNTALAEKWARLSLGQPQTAGPTEAKDSRHPPGAGNPTPAPQPARPSAAIPAESLPASRRILTLQPPNPRLLDLPRKPGSYAQTP